MGRLDEDREEGASQEGERVHGEQGLGDRDAVTQYYKELDGDKDSKTVDRMVEMQEKQQEFFMHMMNKQQETQMAMVGAMGGAAKKKGPVVGPVDASAWGIGDPGEEEDEESDEPDAAAGAAAATTPRDAKPKAFVAATPEHLTLAQKLAKATDEERESIRTTLGLSEEQLQKMIDEDKATPERKRRVTAAGAAASSSGASSSGGAASAVKAPDGTKKIEKPRKKKEVAKKDEVPALRSFFTEDVKFSPSEGAVFSVNMRNFSEPLWAKAKCNPEKETVLTADPSATLSVLDKNYAELCGPNRDFDICVEFDLTRLNTFGKKDVLRSMPGMVQDVVCHFICSNAPVKLMDAALCSYCLKHLQKVDATVALTFLFARAKAGDPLVPEAN